MQQIINTHSHVYTEKFKQDISEVILRAKDSGISHILLPDIDIENRDDMLQLAEKFPEICKYMIGIHPTSVNASYAKELEAFDKAVEQNSPIAIGEIGIDLYWDKTFIEEQILVFKHQILKAHQLQLPIAIHVRNSFDEVFTVLNHLHLKPYRGVFHCFSGNIEQAKQAIDLGFYLGIGGVLTYKNSGLDSVISAISLEHIVIETDDPWLAPNPHRGKRNEPSFITYVAQAIAQIKQESYETVCAITTQNAKALFNI